METQIPTITVSEVAGRAEAYAKSLASNLESLNAKFFHAVLDERNQEIFQKFSGNMDLEPMPAQFIPVFERLFFTYMASRYIIVPDHNSHADNAS